MPLPDHIFTSGELGVRFMQRAGYPEKRLTIAGALRFRHLYDYMKQMPAGEALRKQYGVPQGKSVILVATSPLLQETICMLTDLLEAAEQSRIDMHVIIRCHPEAVHLPGYVAQLERIAQAAGRKITYEFLSGPVSLQDYISLSDAVLLTGGTVALEAMILGCLPLIYMNDSQFSHNPMKEYPDAVLLIDSPAAMKAALDDVFNGRAAQRLRPLWKRPLTDMFSGTSEDPAITFLKAVRERIQILSPPGEDKLY
jgi:glycosyltransferase involved in cell wall biosynthesis